MPSSYSALPLLLEQEIPKRSICVAYGDDEYLQTLVLQKLRIAYLGESEDQLSLREFSGDEASWGEVYQELSTVSMFASHPRLVIVTQADSFVSRFRSHLEKWVSQPIARNVLVLSVRQWPQQTRLAKIVGEKGLAIECSFSKKKRPELVAWIKRWAKHQYGLTLDTDAVELILESVGAACGLVDQELRKLAGTGRKSITAAMVRELTGTWRIKSVWEIIQSAVQGDAANALTELQRLLDSGETPLGLLGMMASTLRRYALATHRYLHPESEMGKVSLQQTLADAGVPQFVLKDEEARLRRLGRHRAQRLIHLLRLADAAMKGALATDPRILLERLIVVLSHPSASDGRLAPL